MPKVSIIILSYNVRDLLLACVASIQQAQTKADAWEIIVVDNASTDNSVSEFKKRYPKIKLIQSVNNLGFSAGNNLGVKQATGEYVLFLNPDTEIKGKAIQQGVKTLDAEPEVGAVTCRVELANGKLDYSCHRGLPTPWNALCYFSGLSKLFPHSPLFAGYTATHLDQNTRHEIDCATGAFLLVRREAGNQIGWWDEDYFWNGEDIEFCYQLRLHHWKIIYDPSEKIIHYKGSSSGLYNMGKTQVLPEIKLQTARQAAKAMKIFYSKHFRRGFVGSLVWVGIILLEQLRLLKIRLGLRYA